MPGRTLPNIPACEVASRNTTASCYVTIGTKVYDVTSFLDAHPGGGDLILAYGGKDVEVIMGDEISHSHSEAANEILEERLIGFVVTEPLLKSARQSELPESIPQLASKDKGIREVKDMGVTREVAAYKQTGMSSAADLSVKTDKHKFLDLNKPLLMQVWNGGFSKDFYLEQVHQAKHKDGESAPLFGNFLEPLSKTAWYVIPIVWLPPVAYGSFLACNGLPSVFQFVLYWLTGLGLWTLVEYGMHRGLFHVDKFVMRCCQ